MCQACINIGCAIIVFANKRFTIFLKTYLFPKSLILTTSDNENSQAHIALYRNCFGYLSVAHWLGVCDVSAVEVAAQRKNASDFGVVLYERSNLKSG